MSQQPTGTFKHGSAAYYLAQARGTYEDAESVTDPETKNILLSIARQYEAAARAAEAEDSNKDG